MTRTLITALALLFAFEGRAPAESSGQATEGAKPAPIAGQLSSHRPGGTADHSLFDSLKKPFASGPEVTQACIACHTEASKQVMGSIHWTWNTIHPSNGQPLGKSRVLNAFCGNVASNEKRCTSCHAGYGWEQMSAGPPKSEAQVDCLVCHDRSGTYGKLEDQAGHPALAPLAPKAKLVTGKPAQPVDLSLAARSVGMPGRENCGTCHFYGGGGDNVKHGDLSSALIAPARSTDVHMAKDGGNFACSHCHISNRHKWAGSRYSVHATDPDGQGKPGLRRDVATCESCHGTGPHKGMTLTALKLNDHTNRVACQTCHIPEFARGGVATKTLWDWSTAGKLKDGKPYAEENFTQSDGKHLHTYLSTKGNFAWEENVKPHYAWFDGQMTYVTATQKVDPSKRLEINSFGGSATDPKSRIWPFKRMEGRQAYDKQYLNLLHNQVFGPDTTTALWTNFDWSKSLKAAMEFVGQPYSGEFGFIDTYMYWPITHMVAPKTDAVTCQECHAKDGRLTQLAGFHLPGGNPWNWLDILGVLGIAGVLSGVIVHAGLRQITGREGGNHG